jgi:hypothetical protein
MSFRPFLVVALSLCACTTQPKITPGTTGGNGGGGGNGTGTGGGGGGAGSGIPSLGDAFFSVSDAAPTGPTDDGPTGTAEKNCGLTTVKLDKNPPELLLVFDRSSSMNQAVGAGMTRFTAAQAAIADALGRTETSILWGLKLFPSAMYCGVTPAVDTPIAIMNAGAVNTAVMVNKPGTVTSGTPTNAAVDAAVAVLKARTTTAHKYLVLATDGEPDCTGATSDDTAIAAVTSAAAAGFPTFVVGIATAMTNADRVLNAMATAGGQPKVGGATLYYSAANKDELTTALTQIIAQVTSCSFALTAVPPSPDDVAVNVNGARVAPGAAGWTYGPNMTSIDIHGPACDALKSAMTSDVSIIFGCPNVPIP